MKKLEKKEDFSPGNSIKMQQIRQFEIVKLEYLALENKRIIISKQEIINRLENFINASTREFENKEMEFGKINFLLETEKNNSVGQIGTLNEFIGVETVQKDVLSNECKTLELNLIRLKSLNEEKNKEIEHKTVSNVVDLQELIEKRNVVIHEKVIEANEVDLRISELETKIIELQNEKNETVFKRKQLFMLLKESMSNEIDRILYQI